MSKILLPLIILRPEPGASATVERAEKLGFATNKGALFAVESLSWQAPDASEFDALILTSANAPREAGIGLEAFKDLPCFAVGEATAEATKEAGINPVWTGKGTGGAALDDAATRGHRRILWLCGEQHTPLLHPKVELTIVPVYRARALPLPPETKEALQHPAIVLLHSQRAAWALAEQMRRRDHIAIIAISAAVAGVAGDGWAWVRWPERPRDQDMLELAARLCQKAT